MNRFAFKCPKCGAIDYSNTSRRSSMRCLKCGSFIMKRSAKDDKQRIDIKGK